MKAAAYNGYYICYTCRWLRSIRGTLNFNCPRHPKFLLAKGTIYLTKHKIL